MNELSTHFFEALRLVKYFHDSPHRERASELFDDVNLNDEDAIFELIYEAMDCVFDQSVTDFNEDYEMEVWVFFDPVIDDFARLCHEYEQRNGLEEGKIPTAGKEKP